MDDYYLEFFPFYEAPAPNLSSILATLKIVVNGALVKVPDWLCSRVLDFLVYNKSFDRCDCNGFMHYVFYVPFAWGKFNYHHLKRKFLASGAVSCQAIDASLAAGNAIELRNNRGEPVHYAFYLGRHLYVNKFGSLGKLIITD